MASLTRTFARPSVPTSVPLFLAPAFARPQEVLATQSRSYAAPRLNRKPKQDKNKQRGVSAIRRTGPRSTRGLWQHPLPVPVARDHTGTAPDYTGSEDHGLWGFFNKKREPMVPPEEESNHGRAWTYQELSVKSFDDLHKLYWVCVKEQNRTLTAEKERRRVRAGYGGLESDERVEAIRETMTLIREVLADRQLSYEQAQLLIRQRPVKELLEGPEFLDEDSSAFEQLPSSDAEQRPQPRPGTAS
ncbi:Large ribosomal subunit protein uL29m [Exophiala dermatitidis]